MLHRGDIPKKFWRCFATDRSFQPPALLRLRDLAREEEAP